MNELIAPNLFLIGFPKCATTTIYNILRSHPEIFMTHLKKPDYFMFKSFQVGLEEMNVDETERQKLIWEVRNAGSHQTSKLNEYELLFKGSETFEWRGEASHYSNFPQVPLEIKSAGITPKILVSIRNPVDRFISHYDMLVREGQTAGSIGEFFQECLDLENVRKHWRYTQRSPLSSGLYTEYIKPYIEVFSRDNVLLLSFEDLKNDYYKTSQIIYEWLNVNTNFKPEFVQRSVGGQFSSDFFQKLNGIARSKTLLPLRSLLSAKIKISAAKLGRKKTMISQDEAKMVKDFYSHDIEELQHLIQCRVPY